VAETGIDRGLGVVLGGDAEVPASLAAGGRMIVHWLIADATRVDAARQEVARRGLGGRVVLGTLPGDGRLPQPDRFVNLLVADLDTLGDGAPASAEIDRVLAVRGASCLRSRGRSETTARSAPSVHSPWPTASRAGATTASTRSARWRKRAGASEAGPGDGWLSAAKTAR